jgi:signal peptidase II
LIGRGAALLAAAIVLVDALVKALIVRTFMPGESRIVVPHLLYLTYVRNVRGAFALGRSPEAVYTALGMLGLVVLALLGRAHTARIARSRRFALALAYGATVGGGAANVVDRAFNGAVVDFIDVRFWPVFNLADVAVTVGLVAIAAISLRAPGAPVGRRHGLSGSRGE